MGYSGQQFRLPLIDTGFRDDRNKELLPATSLVSPSKNVNYHENGLSKRGGSQITITGNGFAGQGIFQFRTANQATELFANNGKVYQSGYASVLKSGLSTQNPICFIQTSSKVFFCDGQTNPQYWDGSSPSTSNVTAPTSWSGNMPFQFVIHTRAGSGAGNRLWAVTPGSLWASKLNAPIDFGDANVVEIPIDSIGGLVGAFDLGGQLFAFSKTQTFLIQDTDSNTANWGYVNAIWEGGLAHWRLVAKANNNLFMMTEDGLIYDLRGVLETGSYNAAPINRPAFVDKYIRDNVNLTNIQNFHVAYDRKLRALKWFMQVSGSTNNIALVQFTDKQPEKAWIIHDNESFTSGYNAAASAEVRLTPGNWQIWTVDFTGNVWILEQPTKDDGGNPYATRIKIKREDLDTPRSNKHFMGIAFRGSTSGTINWSMNIYVEGVFVGTQTFTIGGTGSVFDSAHFDSATFAADILTFDTQMIGVYGRDLQIELLNNMVGQDFFLSEILIFAKLLEIKVPV